MVDHPSEFPMPVLELDAEKWPTWKWSTRLANEILGSQVREMCEPLVLSTKSQINSELACHVIDENGNDTVTSEIDWVPAFAQGYDSLSGKSIELENSKLMSKKDFIGQLCIASMFYGDETSDGVVGNPIIQHVKFLEAQRAKRILGALERLPRKDDSGVTFAPNKSFGSSDSSYLRKLSKRYVSALHDTKFGLPPNPVSADWSDIDMTPSYEGKQPDILVYVDHLQKIHAVGDLLSRRMH